MFSRHIVFSRHVVGNWGIAAQLLGFVVMGCSDSASMIDPVTIPSGGGAGGASSAGHGGSSGSGSSGSGSSGSGSSGSGGAGSAGVGGASVGGAGSVGGAAGAGSAGVGGSGGTRGELGYQPVGIGDPWFFDSEAELEAFAVELAGGASGSAVWNAAGEIHLSTAFTAGGDKAMLHFTAPWDSVASENTTIDLTHRVLKARVRVADGATVDAGLQLYSQSGSWSWVPGDWTSFSSLSGFTEVELDLDASTDPSHVLRFGLQVYANGAGNAELIIDDLRLEPKDEPPAGGGDAGPEADAGVGGNDAGDSSDADAGAGADSGDGGLGYAPLGLGDPWFFTQASDVDAFGVSGATKSWEEPGQMRVSGTLTDGASLAFHFNTPWSEGLQAQTPVDMSGRVVRARIKLGAGTTASGGVEVFSQTTGWSHFTKGSWNDSSSLTEFTDVTLAIDSTPAPTDIIQVGLQFYANTGGDVEIIVDSLRIEPAS